LYWSTLQNQVIELRTGGTFVGQFADTPYLEGQLTLNMGDVLFACTDGLTEAEDINGNIFGMERVKKIFASKRELPAVEFCEYAKNRADRFREGAKQETFDDFTIFELKINQ